MNLIPRNFIIDDFFDDFFPVSRNHDLKCDIYEKDNNYHIEIDVPGYDKKDIKIEEENGYLKVSVEKNEESNDENKNYIRKERKITKYQRSFYLGDVDKDEIKAEIKDGTLKIQIPKKAEIDNKKIIEID